MSTIQSAQPDHARAKAHPLCACTITWPIARKAVVKAQPNLGFNAISSKPIELRITLTADHKAIAELADPANDHSHTIELAAPRITLVDAKPYTHIEITDSTGLILSATLKAEANNQRLLYARTSLLTKLNIKGGRYPAPTYYIFNSN